MSLYYLVNKSTYHSGVKYIGFKAPGNSNSYFLVDRLDNAKIFNRLEKIKIGYSMRQDIGWEFKEWQGINVKS